MKKKITLVITIIILLSTIIGCIPKKEKNEYSCTKNNINQTNSVNKIEYVANMTYTVKLNNKKKLIKYRIVKEYIYNKKEDCNIVCEVFKKWDKDITKHNYSGLTKKTECTCNKKTGKGLQEYDISKLETSFRSDISHLDDDDTFNLEEWLSQYKNSGFTCK